MRVTCENLRVGKSTAYDRRQSDEHFRELWEQVWNEAIDVLEESAMDRAINGCVEPVVSNKGEIVGERVVFNPTREIFMLKKNRPEKYGDKVSMDEDSVEAMTEKIRASIEAMNASVGGSEATEEDDEP